MIPEIGHFALIISLALALVLGTVPLIGAAKGNVRWMSMSRATAQGLFVFVTVSYACLTYAFIQNDFSVLYVAQHSNSALPLEYRIAAVWGGHEGSLLLWALMLAGWSLAITMFSKNLPEEMVARVLAVMGLVSVGFLLFMLLTSNPFDRLLPAAPDGRDLNPLLQDPGLIIHPPLLYMGYVGFSVAFAFAIAALLSGKLDATWARWSRPWTVIAWVFLTGGIALGSWWAYYELGWGGWWFWDPVENASFMPWLVGTALMHSLIVTEKRGGFKTWTVLLAIFTFSLSLLGTFLVRSGVLTSVHAFASDPERGLFILLFLVVVIGSSLALYAWRAPKVGLGGKFDLASRETMLLGNNVFLVVACGAVLLGTLYPLFVDALGGGKMSVGPPYFDAVFLPLMIPLLFLMGVGPYARWKKTDPKELMAKLRGVFIFSVVLALIIPFIIGEWKALVALSMLLALWLTTTIVLNIWQRVSMNKSGGSVLSRLGHLPRTYWGMQIAHLGVAMFIVGVAIVNGYEQEKDVRMDTGDVVHVAGYDFRFDGVIEIVGPNYEGYRGLIHVSKEGEYVTTLHPEKRIYNVQKNPMTEAGIDSGFFRHVYASLGEALPDGSWTLRAYYKPFVTWIWTGCALMMLGGVIAICDRRYRLVKKAEKLAKKRKQQEGIDKAPEAVKARVSEVKS